MSDLVQALTEKMAKVANPEWYLRLLGSVLEESENVERGIVIADNLYDESPFPPSTDSDKAWEIVGNSEAMEDFEALNDVDLSKVIENKKLPKVKPSPFKKK